MYRLFINDGAKRQTTHPLKEVLKSDMFFKKKRKFRARGLGRWERIAFLLVDK